MMISLETLLYIGLGVFVLRAAYCWGYASGSIDKRMELTGEPVEVAVHNELKEHGK
jgi:hypothetical protein